MLGGLGTDFRRFYFFSKMSHFFRVLAHRAVQDSVLFENTTINDITGDNQQAIDSAAIRLKQIHIGSGDEPASRTRYQEPSVAQLATVHFTPLETNLASSTTSTKVLSHFSKSPKKLAEKQQGHAGFNTE